MMNDILKRYNILEKYKQAFLTSDFYNDQKVLAPDDLVPMIRGFLHANGEDLLVDNHTNISAFAKSVFAETNQEKFESFLTELKLLVDELNLDFRGSADIPNYDNLSITLSFDTASEDQIDRLIRFVRNNLTNNFRASGQYPLAVWKAFITSSDCWSVEFRFSPRWEFKEDIQG
ncbi:hypothetical protein DMK83_11910 [Vibrio parahaemolyticus]|nr:hypothetical protein [Vibrio parahaemolyticus]